MASQNGIATKGETQSKHTIQRRTALTALPLAIFGLTAVAKGKVGLSPTQPGILDERSLSYVLEHVTEASTTDISCTFVGLAAHLEVLARQGDCKRIRALAAELTERLYAEHNSYNEPREKWLSEELGYLAECVDMDDESLGEAESSHATKRANARHIRRGGEV
jgi:hypothetical protein